MSYFGILLSGKAGAGKNEFARIFADELAIRGGWPREFAFAQALKVELLVEHSMTKEDPGGREKLVEIGHARRQEDEDYWVKRTAEQIAQLMPYGVTPIITDCRYANELAWGKRLGFVTIRIDASAIDRAYALAQRGENSDFVYSDHASECELDEADFHLRFTNPHSDIHALTRAVFWALDLFLGDVDWDTEGVVEIPRRLDVVAPVLSKLRGSHRIEGGTPEAPNLAAQ